MISIIVPVYNVEKYIGENIESVLGQTYSDWELLLINDGSLDKSLQICQRYSRKDKRIRIFDTPNKGVCAARNLGLDNANGQFITFLDSDDILEYNALETMATLMEKSGCDMVSCEVSCTIDERSSIKKVVRKNLEDEILNGENYVNAMLSGRFMVSVWAKLYRRSTIGDRRFPEDLTLGEDSFFNLLTLGESKHKCYVSNAPIYRYRILKSSISRRKGAYEMESKYVEHLYRFVCNSRNLKHVFYSKLALQLTSLILKSPKYQPFLRKNKNLEYANILRDLKDKFPGSNDSLKMYSDRNGVYYYLKLNQPQFNILYSFLPFAEAIVAFGNKLKCKLSRK